MLSDWTIRSWINSGRLLIKPTPKDEDLQPCTVDVHLANKGLRWKDNLPHNFFIDPSKDMSIYMDEFDIYDYESVYGGYLIAPGAFILSSISEHITLTEKFAALVHGKSSLARLGLIVHLVAGLADPGWYGNITLEILNVNQYPIRIWSGMLIAQVSFEELTTACVRPYGHPERNSRYQGDTGVVPSRYHLPMQSKLPPTPAPRRQIIWTGIPEVTNVIRIGTFDAASDEYAKDDNEDEQ